MAIFPHLDLEPVVQIGDRTRLSGTQSFVTQDESEISTVLIKPQGGGTFVDVTTDKYLDWQYSAAGNISVTIRVVAGSASADYTDSISVVSANQDKLFSTDADLRLHEPDILKWTEDGRNTYLNTHRRAKRLLLDYLRTEGFVDVYGNPYTDAAIIDIEEVKQWATFITLRLIFEGISNSSEDIFHEKAKRYNEMELKSR